MGSFRLGLIAFLIAAVAPVAVIGGVNAIVDPYNITLWTTIKGVNEVLPTLPFQSRTTKALGLQRFKPDVVLIGSSVVDNGFGVLGATEYDGDRRRYIAAVRAGHVDGMVYNAAIRGGGTYEALTYLQAAHRANPNLKRAIIGLEWGLFSVKNDANRPPDSLFLNRFAPWLGAFKYLTLVALEDSVRTVQRNRREPQDGFRKLPELMQRLLIADANAQAPRPRRMPTLHSNHVVEARNPIETRMFYFSALNASALSWRLRRGQPDLKADAVANLQAMADYARANDIELVVFAGPQHALYWAAMREAGVWEGHERWLRAMAQITPYREFSEEVEFAANADALFRGDPLHYQTAVGDLLLPELTRPMGEAAQIGRTVTPQTIEAALAARTARLDRWLDAHAYWRDVFPAVALRCTRYSGPNDVLPIEFAPAPQNTRILRMLKKYYALPAQAGPYDLRRVLLGDYEGERVADRFEDLAGGGRARAAGYATGPLSDACAQGQPARAFDGQAQTMWLSAERGGAVTGRSWIGYGFETPRSVRHVRIEQARNPRFQPAAVMVQFSRDSGARWEDALSAPAPADARLLDIATPAAAPARHWRVIAAGAPNPDSTHVWAVLELEFAE
jgi:hypothetical protein